MQRATESARVDLARLVAVGKDAAGLGHAPHLDQRETETLLEGPVQLRFDASAKAEAHVVALLVFRHRTPKLYRNTQSRRVPPSSQATSAVSMACPFW